MTEEKKILRNDAWDKAIQSFGKSYIFNKRAKFYNNWIRFVTILGIIVPIAIGATASGYGLNSSILKWTMTISIPLTILQLMISVFAIANKWNENLSYSLEASNDYGNLSEGFKKLGRNPPKKTEKFKHKLELFETKYNLRVEQDTRFNLKEWELRKGMRYALREFQRPCVGCEKIPLSMNSISCQVCGNFNRNLIYKLLFNG